MTHVVGTSVAWDRPEAELVRSAVFAVQLRSEPSAHVYVENAFSP